MYGKLPNKMDLLQNKLKVCAPRDADPELMLAPCASLDLAAHEKPTTQERKFFDSGDYALSKAGKASDAGVTQIGSRHPNPENIPHLTSPAGNGNGTVNGHAAPGGHGLIHQGSSPVKESSFLHRETSVNDLDEKEAADKQRPSQSTSRKDDVESGAASSVSPPPVIEGVPIRQ